MPDPVPAPDGIKDHVLDWMYEDECAANQRGYVKRLVKEVMRLQGELLTCNEHLAALAPARPAAEGVTGG